jgi:hypothetical protein
MAMAYETSVGRAWTAARVDGHVKRETSSGAAALPAKLPLKKLNRLFHKS